MKIVTLATAAASCSAAWPVPRWPIPGKMKADTAAGAGAATTTNPAERRAFKEEYRRGGCKMERKWDDDEYKEEIKCKRRARPIYGSILVCNRRVASPDLWRNRLDLGPCIRIQRL